MVINTIEARPQRIGFGIFLILLAVFLMALQDGIIKLASSNVSLWQLYVLRALIALPILIVISVFSVKRTAVWTDAFERWAMLRAGLLVMMYITIYAAIPVLPLTVVAGGMYTAPLFIAVLSAILIKEPVHSRGWVAVALGAAGVTLVLRLGTEVFTPVALLPVLAGFFYALAAILARSRCQTHAPLGLAMALNIALLATGLLASLMVLFVQPTLDQTAISPFLFSPWAVLKFGDWALIAVLAILIVSIGIGLAAAYQVAPPAIIATFDYSYLVFASLFGFLFFSEIPDWPTIAGMVLIASAGLIAVSRPRS